MVADADHRDMGTVLVLLFLLLIGPLALWFGADSRPLDAHGRRRRWL